MKEDGRVNEANEAGVPTFHGTRLLQRLHNIYVVFIILEQNSLILQVKKSLNYSISIIL